MSYLGEALLNLNDNEAIERGAYYLWHGAKSYDVAGAFVDRLDSNLTEKDDETGIRIIMQKRKEDQLLDKMPWRIE